MFQSRNLCVPLLLRASVLKKDSNRMMIGNEWCFSTQKNRDWEFHREKDLAY